MSSFFLWFGLTAILALPSIDRWTGIPWELVGSWSMVVGVILLLLRK